MTDSIKKYTETKEYIVTLKSSEDLESFYAEMQDQGRFEGSTAPERAVSCVDLKPFSRSTHYMLTEWEAMELKEDFRVESVSIHSRYLGMKPGTFTTRTQTSSNWNKSGSTSNVMLNWALLRCTEGVNRSGWGSDGTTNQTGTVTITSTGKNVDVVVVDAGNPDAAHPEYAVNANGTGGSRMINYNWFQHNLAVRGTAPGTYSNPTHSHSVHVSGTVAGNTQGWARDANIYNIYYDAGNSGDFSYVFGYVKEFHKNKSVNPATGIKNPTICNNSWGQSIFPSEWTMSDITAVTYRGTRYTPSGATTYTGYSGVCNSSERLAVLLGFENFGNRITTTGPYTPPGGSILTKPASWSQEGQQTYLTTFSAPDASYSVTVQGPADISLINNVAAEAFSGTVDLTSSITIKKSDNSVVDTFTQGPFSDIAVETNIRQDFSLVETDVYTIVFDTTLDLTNAETPAIAVAMSLLVNTTPVGTTTATVTEITNSLLGAASLASSTTPTTGNNDDGFWTLTLPFNISFLGNTYSTIYVGTNHYVTFTSGSTIYSGLGPATPNLPKIMWSCADNSVQRIYYGVEGTAPNRTYRVRMEGTASTGGTVGSPNMVNEFVFYEATPSQIDLQLGTNARKTVGGGFTTEQLNAWGFIAGQRIPARVPGCDADIVDAIAEGVIMVGAAGNGLWKHDVPGGLDWDNTFEMASRYPASVANPYYYMRGTSPTANDVNIPNICVGAIDVTSADQKSSYSDCGPGVDIWAPGTSIISSYLSGVSDSRNASYQLGKISGTSMASPNVCGVLACALEQNPRWNQVQAKAYIMGIAKQGQINASTGGPADIRDLQGAPNLYLYYKKERPTEGQTIPTLSQGVRPTSGMAWPRTRIFRFG